MAYDYLDITNEVIARMNEVSLTAANFTAARGFQVQCKNAVNDSINYINQREFGWPFTHLTHTQTLVAGQTRYSIPTTSQSVDYDTFRISRDNTLAVAGTTLRILDYKEYTQKYISQETTTSIGSVPKFVFRTPDNNGSKTTGDFKSRLIKLSGWFTSQTSNDVSFLSILSQLREPVFKYIYIYPNDSKSSTGDTGSPQ